MQTISLFWKLRHPTDNYMWDHNRTQKKEKQYKYVGMESYKNWRWNLKQVNLRVFG